MPSLSPGRQKVLKIVHLLAVACWLGGAWAMMSIYWLRNGPLVTTDGLLAGVDQTLHHIDYWVVVIPGAIGCLLTGLVYCIFTRWGFFRHFWVGAKVILTMAAILFGTFFLGPWEETLVATSSQTGLAALVDPAYLSAQTKNTVGGFIQICVCIFMVYLSVVKPKLKKGAPKS